MLYIKIGIEVTNIKTRKSCSHSSPYAVSSEWLGVQFVLSFSLDYREKGSVNNAQHHGGISPWHVHQEETETQIPMRKNKGFLAPSS